MKIITTLSLLAVLLASCNTSKKIVEKKNADMDNICNSMTFNSQPVSKLSSDYYTIDTLFIVDNCLNMWVSYSGGCGNADFKLYYTDRMVTSMPPKTTLRLQLTDNDPCRAIIQQKLYFNISFFDDYAKKTGILLKFAGSNKSILYKK